MLASWGRWVYRFRWWVLIISVLSLGPSLWLISQGGHLDSVFVPANTEAGRALDLTKSEAELFANMKGNSCRTSIRRTIKKGVMIEEAIDPGFADEYYAQYQEVYARKSLPPFYDLDFVRQMIAHLQPMGNLLLLRARNSEGVCIATHIDLIFNKVAVVWGSASLKQYLFLRPNELIYWYAMKRVKTMGIEVLQLADGVKQFKEKLGAYETQAFRLMKAKNPFLYFPLFAAISIHERMKLWTRKVMGGWFMRSE